MSARTAAEILRGRIEMLRKNNRLSKTQLTKEMGVSPSWLTDVLKGRRGAPLPKLDQLARALNTTVAELFTDRDQAWQGDPAPSEHPRGQPGVIDGIRTRKYGGHNPALSPSSLDHTLGAAPRTRTELAAIQRAPDP